MTNRIAKFENMVRQAAGTDAELHLTDGEIVFLGLTDDRDWLQVRIDNDHTFETFTVSTNVDGWMDMLHSWICSTIQLLDPPMVPDLPTGEFSVSMGDEIEEMEEAARRAHMDDHHDDDGVLRLSRRMIEVPMNDTSDENDEDLPF